MHLLSQRVAPESCRRAVTRSKTELTEIKPAKQETKGKVMLRVRLLLLLYANIDVSHARKQTPLCMLLLHPVT